MKDTQKCPECKAGNCDKCTGAVDMKWISCECEHDSLKKN